MKNFRKALEFQKVLKKFNLVYRGLNSIHDPKKLDNNVEHSYRVAMLCWMINEEYELGYSTSKILKYALLHDFVEVYAGDKTLSSNYSHKIKKENEHKALLRLNNNFPKLESLWKNIERYEKQKDIEAKFVYLMEKLEPIFTIILSKGDPWLQKKVSIEDFMQRKQKKIKDLEIFAQIFNIETMEYLKKNKKKFFKS
jgi:5'-deoxynucleotidase YfbR-like HD superfamily hydrolase